MNRSQGYIAVLTTTRKVAILTVSTKGLRGYDQIKFLKWLAVDDAVCISMDQSGRMIAVGKTNGDVHLMTLSDGSLGRILSLTDWGFSESDTGPVKTLSWTPDSAALACGWSYRGLAVWSASGCRLMATIRQVRVKAYPPKGNSLKIICFRLQIGTHRRGDYNKVENNKSDVKTEALIHGAADVAWGTEGYHLLAIDNWKCECLYQFSFLKAAIRGNQSISFVQILQV